MNNSASGITEMINAIRKLTGVGICYYDLNAFFQYDKYGVKNNRGHYCAFCEKARSLFGGRQGCDRSDKIEAVELAKQYKAPFFHECHMGMRELVIPLLHNDALLGILFVGQCRTENDQSEVVKESAKRMKGDPDEFLALYQILPLITRKDLLEIGTILSQYFDNKILTSEHLYPSELRNAEKSDLASDIRSYIKQNYKYSISTKQLAEAFFVNASYASRCFSERYDITITEYISKVRIEKAKTLLLTTKASIGNIALNVGFDDSNYFTRVFKKLEGCSPSSYRSRFQSPDE